MAGYLDWVCENLHYLGAAEVISHLHAAELVIRTRATDAQAKDTQHTLIRDGVIDAPSS